jgi:arylsulfatase A-like enzyme
MIDKTINDLKRLSKSDKPFFIAAGLRKPHLPFNAPKKYWDMYPLEKIDLAANPFRAKDAPEAAYHGWHELRGYFGMPKKEKMPDDVARKLIQGYYACTTYADAQIGRLLDTLDELNLRENTIVLLIGDHGWNLGEHTLWCKHCNFDTSLRAPMIISAGGMTKNRTSDSLVEFIDLFPTLCDLAGLDKPDQLQGKSLVPILKDPKVKVKDAVFSRYHDGESIRTDRYLYTEWLNEKGQIHSRMLYDHKTDPAENVNIAEKPENATIVSELSQKLAQLRQQPW